MASFQARLKDRTKGPIDHDANNGSAYDASQIRVILHAAMRYEEDMFEFEGFDVFRCLKFGRG